jgi:hypothetical protein
MSDLAVPLIPANLDLITRILKEDTDEQTFTNFIRVTYGVDLYNPDGVPFEQLQDLRDVTSTEEKTTSAPVPFSTSALNSILEVFGRRGDISRLVQTFEVLTQALPKGVSPTWAQDGVNDEEDGDDENAFVNPSTPVQISAPHAPPNTTSYNVLLRYICQIGNSIMAKHYLFDAFRLDVATETQLRAHINSRPLEDIPAPHFAMNRAMFNSVLGLANRDKDIEFLQWILRLLQENLAKKKSRLQFWKYKRAKLFQGEVQTATTDSVGSQSSTDTPNRSPKPRETLIFELDLDQDVFPSQHDIKMFDLDLHINILEHSIPALEQLEDELIGVIARVWDRLKEHLGRRVWNNKDVYLRSTNLRQRVSPERWLKEVNFRKGLVNEYQRPRQKPGFPSARSPALPSFVGTTDGESLTQRLLLRRGRERKA